MILHELIERRNDESALDENGEETEGRRTFLRQGRESFQLLDFTGIRWLCRLLTDGVKGVREHEKEGESMEREDVPSYFLLKGLFGGAHISSEYQLWCTKKKERIVHTFLMPDD